MPSFAICQIHEADRGYHISNDRNIGLNSTLVVSRSAWLERVILRRHQFIDKAWKMQAQCSSSASDSYSGAAAPSRRHKINKHIVLGRGWVGSQARLACPEVV